MRGDKLSLLLDPRSRRPREKGRRLLRGLPLPWASHTPFLLALIVAHLTVLVSATTNYTFNKQDTKHIGYWVDEEASRVTHLTADTSLIWVTSSTFQAPCHLGQYFHNDCPIPTKCTMEYETTSRDPWYEQIGHKEVVEYDDGSRETCFKGGNPPNRANPTQSYVFSPSGCMTMTITLAPYVAKPPAAATGPAQFVNIGCRPFYDGKGMVWDPRNVIYAALDIPLATPTAEADVGGGGGGGKMMLVETTTVQVITYNIAPRTSSTGVSWSTVTVGTMITITVPRPTTQASPSAVPSVTLQNGVPGQDQMSAQAGDDEEEQMTKGPPSESTTAAATDRSFRTSNAIPTVTDTSMPGTDTPISPFPFPSFLLPFPSLVIPTVTTIPANTVPINNSGTETNTGTDNATPTDDVNSSMETGTDGVNAEDGGDRDITVKYDKKKKWITAAVVMGSITGGIFACLAGWCVFSRWYIRRVLRVERRRSPNPVGSPGSSSGEYDSEAGAGVGGGGDGGSASSSASSAGSTGSTGRGLSGFGSSRLNLPKPVTVLMAGIAGLTGLTHQLARYCPSNLVRIVRRARYGPKSSSSSSSQEDLKGRITQGGNGDDNPFQDPPLSLWQHQGVLGYRGPRGLLENGKCGNCRDCNKEKERETQKKKNNKNKKNKNKNELRNEFRKTVGTTSQLSIIDEVTEPGSKRGSGVKRALSIEEVMEGVAVGVEDDGGEEVDGDVEGHEEKDEGGEGVGEGVEGEVDEKKEVGEGVEVDGEEENVGEDVEEEKREGGISSETEKGEEEVENKIRETWPVSPTTPASPGRLLLPPASPRSPSRLPVSPAPDDECAGSIGSRKSGETVNVYLKRGSGASCLSLPLGGTSSENKREREEVEVEAEVEEEVDKQAEEVEEVKGVEGDVEEQEEKEMKEVNDEAKEMEVKEMEEDEKKKEEVRYSWPTSPTSPKMKEAREMGTRLSIIDEVTEPGSKRVSGVESTSTAVESASSPVEELKEEVEVEDQLGKRLEAEEQEEAKDQTTEEVEEQEEAEAEAEHEVRDSWPSWPSWSSSPSSPHRLLEPPSDDDDESPGSRESREMVHVYFGE